MVAYNPLTDCTYVKSGEKVPGRYEELVAPHIESFNYFVGPGLKEVVQNLDPVTVSLHSLKFCCLNRIEVLKSLERQVFFGFSCKPPALRILCVGSNPLEFPFLSLLASIFPPSPRQLINPNTQDIMVMWVEDAEVHKPRRDFACKSEFKLYPRDCREMGTTYKGDLTATLCYSLNGGEVQRVAKKLGGIPIMTRSSKCWLEGLTKRQLIGHGEEDNEFGGYFVCNGIERMIRMLIATRRNYIIALRRGAYQKRGPIYTDYATLIRCVRRDYASQVVRCHYLTDGTVNVALTIQRAEYFLPAGVLLRCFIEVSDRELFDRLVSSAPGPGEGVVDETGGHQGFVAERAEMLLRQGSQLGLRTRSQCLSYVGDLFRPALGLGDELTAEECGERLLRDYVFLHLDRAEDKLGLLVLMLQKLYALTNSQW